MDIEKVEVGFLKENCYVLKKNNKSININENSMTTVNDSKAINENKSYKSDDLIKTIDLINRVMKY